MSAQDELLQQRAQFAMSHTMHVGDSYWYWFIDEAYFKSRAQDILFLGFQERLKTDFAELKLLLQLPESAQLPCDDVRAHKTPEGLDRSLDPLAIENLRCWYKA